jgi:hypothetical protein
LTPIEFQIVKEKGTLLAFSRCRCMVTVCHLVTFYKRGARIHPEHACNLSLCPFLTQHQIYSMFVPMMFNGFIVNTYKVLGACLGSFETNLRVIPH